MYVVQCISGYCLAPDMSAFIGRHKNDRKRVLSARRSAGSMQLGSAMEYLWNSNGNLVTGIGIIEINVLN